MALTKGAVIGTKVDNSDNPPSSFEAAVLGGKVETLEFMLNTQPYDFSPSETKRLLLLASQYGGIDMVTYLVEKLNATVDETIISSARRMAEELDYEKQMRVVRYLEDHLTQ